MTATNDVEYVRIKKSEFDIRYKHVWLTAMDVETLIEHTEVIKKRINECMYDAQNKLHNLQLVGKEGEAYSMIAVGDKMKIDLEKMEEKYKQHIIDLSEWKV